MAASEDLRRGPEKRTRLTRGGRCRRRRALRSELKDLVWVASRQRRIAAEPMAGETSTKRGGAAMARARRRRRERPERRRRSEPGGGRGVVAGRSARGGSREEAGVASGKERGGG